MTKLKFNNRDEIKTRYESNSDILPYNIIDSIQKNIKDNIKRKYEIGTEVLPYEINHLEDYVEYETKVSEFYGQFDRDAIAFQWFCKNVSHRDLLIKNDLKKTKVRLYFVTSYNFNNLLEAIGYQYRIPQLSSWGNNWWDDDQVTVYKNKSIKIKSDTLFALLKPLIIKYGEKYNFSFTN